MSDQPESGEARHPAIENLRNCQRQLDMDGCEVGVSRQAVDETLAEIDRLHSALAEAQEIIDTRTHNATVLSESYMACKDGYDHISKRLTTAQQRIAALHASLRTYGWHKPECDYMQEELPCTCGFLTAVERDFPEIGPLPGGDA